MDKRKETLAGWLFLMPALIVFLTLVVFAIIVSFGISFTKWNYLSGFSGIEWVGFDNFIRFFTIDRRFKMALGNTIIYAVATAPLSGGIEMLLAYFINDRVYFRKFSRMCFFVPYISSMVALTAVFRFLFRSDGPINAVLINLFGVDKPPAWLTSTDLCKIPVICVMIYASVGFSLIVYMAALQNVPGELYEAAMIDGANGFLRFFRITIPLISPTTFYLLIVRLIFAFKAFTAINVMGMADTAPSLVTEIYRNAFRSYNFGYASAEAWILVVIILLVTMVKFGYQKKWVNYIN